MTTSNAPAPKEVAALLVIGDKILSAAPREKLGLLFVVAAERSAGCSVYEMHPSTRRAGDRLIGLAFVCGHVFGEPCLHVHARCGASKYQGGHRAL